jgi:hypothetical protein
MSRSSARLRTLKITNNVFTVRNVFYPYKDYSSFLGGKLIVFHLCIYDQGNGVDFEIVSNYFVVYETYFVVGEFQ